MRNKSAPIWVMVAVLFMATGQGFGVTYFNDGGTHNIDYSEGYVYVDYETPGMHTTVNLLNGGTIFKFWAYQDSRINISGGSVDLFLAVADNSQVTMSGGSVDLMLNAGGNSQVAISGGTAANLESSGNSQVTMSGGTVSGNLHTMYSSQVTMSGGSVGYDLLAQHSSQVTMSGGTIAGSIILMENAILALDGSNFAINGTPFSSGEITSILGGDYSSDPFRTLTGTLANSDIINNQFRIGNDASIVLVPEPATILLLGLGAVLLRKI